MKGRVGRALIPAFIVLALSASAVAAPIRRRPPQVFLLSSSPDSLIDLQRHVGAVGAVYPTFFDCRLGSGSLTGSASAQVAQYAHVKGLQVMPRFNCQDGPTVHRILTEPSLRAATLNRLAAIGAASGNRGVCLDLENDGAEDRAAMTSFVQQLARRLHAHGKRLTVVVVGVTQDEPRTSSGFYDDAAIGQAADSVFVLAWGTHWAGSEPGPISTLAFVRGVAAYVSSLPSSAKFALGAPMYGLDWSLEPEPGGGEAAAYQYSQVTALARRVGATPRRDAASGELTFGYTDSAGVRHVVWYMDAHAVALILRAGRDAGLGVGLWRLGEEDQRLWGSPLLSG